MLSCWWYLEQARDAQNLAISEQIRGGAGRAPAPPHSICAPCTTLVKMQWWVPWAEFVGRQEYSVISGIPVSRKIIFPESGPQWTFLRKNIITPEYMQVRSFATWPGYLGPLKIDPCLIFAMILWTNNRIFGSTSFQCELMRYRTLVWSFRPSLPRRQKDWHLSIMSTMNIVLHRTVSLGLVIISLGSLSTNRCLLWILFVRNSECCVVLNQAKRT